MVSKSLLSLIFLSVLLALCGLRAIDIAVIILLAAVQVSFGSRIWSTFRASQQVCFAEAIGMGAAIGFGLSMMSSQVFRTVLPRSIAWIIFPFLVTSVVAKFFKKPQIKSEVQAQKISEICIVVTGTIIALSVSWYWLIPTAIAALSATIWVLLLETKSTQAKIHGILTRVVGLISIALFVRAAIVLNSLESVRNPVWWSWRFAKIQDPDVLFVESMMRSTRLLGGSGSIFFVGAKLHYHWFSFAWNDTLNAIFETNPFAISGIAGPILVLFVVMCLLSAIANRLSTNKLSAFVTVIAVAAMCAGPIPFLRLLHPYSYSFNYSLIFTLAIVIILLSQDTTKISLNLALMFLFSAMVVGSKVSSAPAIVSGFLAINLVALLRKDSISKRLFLISTAAAAATIAVWIFVYYAPDADKSNSFEIGIGEIFIQKAFLSPSLPIKVFLVGFISLILVICFSLTGLLFLRQLKPAESRHALVFVLTGGSISLVIALVLSDDLESSAYLIQTAFALLLPFSIIALSNHLQSSALKKPLIVLPFVVIGILLAKLSWSLVDGVSGNAASVVYKSSRSILLPIIISLLFLIFTAFFSSLRLRQGVALVSVLLVSAGTFGSYAAFAADFYRDGVNLRELRVDDADTVAGSSENRLLLLWLRENSRTEDIVATNRFCSDSYEVPPNCLSLWSLTSAISMRQVLGEETPGARLVGFESERERRRLLVESFVEEPSVQNRTSLLDYGVRWVVADYAVTKKRSWGEFAEVRFTNEAGAILELTDSDS